MLEINIKNLASSAVRRREGQIVHITGKTQFSFTEKCLTDDEFFQKLRLLLKRTKKTQMRNFNYAE